eukprot:COSAG05_NODE_898_length_6685_cov_4.419223_6_plen_81_part_00
MDNFVKVGEGFAVVKKGQPCRSVYFLESGVCQMRSGNNVMGYIKPGTTCNFLCPSLSLFLSRSLSFSLPHCCVCVYAHPP